MRAATRHSPLSPSKPLTREHGAQPQSRLRAAQVCLALLSMRALGELCPVSGNSPPEHGCCSRISLPCLFESNHREWEFRAHFASQTGCGWEGWWSCGLLPFGHTTSPHTSSPCLPLSQSILQPRGPLLLCSWLSTFHTGSRLTPSFPAMGCTPRGCDHGCSPSRQELVPRALRRALLR